MYKAMKEDIDINSNNFNNFYKLLLTKNVKIKKYYDQ